jgi:hypothetical protein
VWKKAFESQFSEQRLFDNIAAVVANLFIRVTGWLILEVLLYRGDNIFSFSSEEKSTTAP